MTLELTSSQYKCCDGVSRRSFLKAGALAFGGLTLSKMLQLEARAAAEGVAAATKKSVILIWKGGGPSHMDTWDLKPDAPSEFRGTYNPIPTSLDGCQVSEHLPLSAKICNKIAIVRSTTHGDAGHESATHFLLTGYPPTNDIPSNEEPSYGSIVAKELGAREAGFPAYVTVPNSPRSSAAAYLGVAYNPFVTQGDPNNDGFSVRNLKLPGGVTLERLQNREAMLKTFDTLRRDVDSSGLVAGMDTFTQQAVQMVTSPKVQEAFDLTKEDKKLRENYGRHTWGQSALLARRLVENGVRFVTVDMGGWDTHSNNFEDMKRNQLPHFDRAFSGLITDLDERGMLDSTLVLVWGEFGRTPRINGTAGRDHWPNAFSTVMAGGGIKRGIVLGSSDAHGEFPKERPITPQDILATMYDRLGIARDKAFVNEANRPVEILNYGQPIKELI